jgi:hypothetical protein
MRKIGFIATLLIVVVEVAWAYERPTHKDLSEHAARSSVLVKNEKVLSNIGVQNIEQKFPDSNGDAADVVELIRNGADFEDNNIRPLNHFFDPTTDTGLLFTSPTWALEDRGQIPVLQAYSYADARKYFYDALIKPVKTDREKNFGFLFETLGRVIHHIQDMAQPQHVRLDTHLKVGDQSQTEWFFENRSRYEDYTLGKGANLPFSGYITVYSEIDTSTFNTPRKFWSNVGKGLADFTNRNFVSAGSNFDTNRYPAPTLAQATPRDEDANVLLQLVGIAPPPECPPTLPGEPLKCVMTFLGTPIQDAYSSGASGFNDKTSTSSIFDQDLIARGGAPVFSLNRFNFDAAHEFLIPRAVSYSAGLIDYFFRGKIDLVPNPSTPGSYRIKNIGVEGMVGTFALYYDAVDGNRHAVPEAAWQLGIAGNGQSDPLSFTPPTDPRPKSTGAYMLVFNGDMGEEKAGNGFIGAVTGKKIVLPPDLYVADLLGRKILHFDSNGIHISSHPTNTTASQVVNGVSAHNGDYFFNWNNMAGTGGASVKNGISFTSNTQGNDTATNSNNVFVTDVVGSRGDRVEVKVFDFDGLYQHSFFTNPNFFNLGGSVNVVANNTHFATTNNEQLHIYTLTGALVSTIAGLSIGSQEAAMTVDRVYAVDDASIRIYDLNGVFQGSIDISFTFLTQCIEVTEDKLYVIVIHNDNTRKIHIYDRFVARNKSGEIISDDYTYRRAVDITGLATYPYSCSVDR